MDHFFGSVQVGDGCVKAALLAVLPAIAERVVQYLKQQIKFTWTGIPRDQRRLPVMRCQAWRRRGRGVDEAEVPGSEDEERWSGGSVGARWLLCSAGASPSPEILGILCMRPQNFTDAGSAPPSHALQCVSAHITPPPCAVLFDFSQGRLIAMVLQCSSSSKITDINLCSSLF